MLLLLHEALCLRQAFSAANGLRASSLPQHERQTLTSACPPSIIRLHPHRCNFSRALSCSKLSSKTIIHQRVLVPPLKCARLYVGPPCDPWSLNASLHTPLPVRRSDQPANLPPWHTGSSPDRTMCKLLYSHPIKGYPLTRL